MPIKYTDEYWDHERARRNSQLSARRHRLDVSIPSAVEVAAAVKQVDILKGAELIEVFVASERERMQLEALAAGST